MKKWEYSIPIMGDEKIDISEISKFLDMFGEAGWELVTFYEGHYIFKREKDR